MSTPTSTVKLVSSRSSRTANLKPCMLAGVSGATAEQVAWGVEVIDPGGGNPDLHPPQEAFRAQEAAPSAWRPNYSSRRSRLPSRLRATSPGVRH